MKSLWNYNADTLRQKARNSKSGVSLLGISETAEEIGEIAIALHHALESKSFSSSALFLWS